MPSTRKNKRFSKTRNRKQVPWAGWGKLSPQGKQRTTMFKKCGQKCFLGTKTIGDKQHPDFPICAKGTCKVNTKGLYAAYIRARQWGKSTRSYKGKSRPKFPPYYYRKIARKAKTMLKKRGIKVGK